MKLKYKKLVILITIATLGLSFFILTLIPTGSNKGNAEDAELELNKNEDINQLINNYFTAKKTVDVDALSGLVSDSNWIETEKFIKMAEYVEDYENLKCYVIKSEEDEAWRVYVKYDMKLKNIDTLAPCLSAFYVTMTSDGEYIIFLSALDTTQEDFILSADNNENIIKLKEQVVSELQTAIDKDSVLKQFYQNIDQEVESALNSDNVTGVTQTAIQ